MSRCSSRKMNKDEVFSIWAPDGSLWSRWAKAVLFAYLDAGPSQTPVSEATIDVSWSPAPGGNVALVIDLPGAKGSGMESPSRSEDIGPYLFTTPFLCRPANLRSTRSPAEQSPRWMCCRLSLLLERVRRDSPG